MSNVQSPQLKTWWQITEEAKRYEPYLAVYGPCKLEVINVDPEWGTNFYKCLLPGTTELVELTPIFFAADVDGLELRICYYVSKLFGDTRYITKPIFKDSK